MTIIAGENKRFTLYQDAIQYQMEYLELKDGDETIYKTGIEWKSSEYSFLKRVTNILNELNDQIRVGS